MLAMLAAMEKAKAEAEAEAEKDAGDMVPALPSFAVARRCQQQNRRRSPCGQRRAGTISAAKAEVTVSTHRTFAGEESAKERRPSQEQLERQQRDRSRSVHNYLGKCKRRASLDLQRPPSFNAEHHVGNFQRRVHDHHVEEGGGDLISVLAAYHSSEAGAAEALASHTGFYSDKALLQRESLRFEPEIRELLDKIWHATDRVCNGYCSREEYRHLHEALFRMMHGEPKMEAVEQWEMKTFAKLKLHDEEVPRKAAFLARLADDEVRQLSCCRGTLCLTLTHPLPCPLV